MKNITTIERIAMQKTAIGKTRMKKITAKITTTALLFFLLLFYNRKNQVFLNFVVYEKLCRNYTRCW